MRIPKIVRQASPSPSPPPPASDLPPELRLLREMTDASFREMNLEAMLTRCAGGLGDILDGQGAAILIAEDEDCWLLHAQFRCRLRETDREALFGQWLERLAAESGAALPEASVRKDIRDPGTTAEIQAPGNWESFPLRAEDQFLGLLALDLGERPALPPELQLILHHLCTGLLSIRNLRELLITDTLTGCRNRWFMDVELSKFCEATPPLSPCIALLLVDVDHFKRINDGHGHACGDRLLMELGELLRKHVEKGDADIRMGGDEFLLWFPHAEGRDLQALGARLLADAAANLRLPGHPEQAVTLSLGLVIHHPDLESIDKAQLLDRADHALYTSKSKGRNRMAVWTPALENQPWLWAEPEESEIRGLREKIHELEKQRAEDRNRLVDLLSQILGTKEYETALHSQRVARITEHLLEFMDLPEARKTEIHHGALLHDIGKIAIPEAILHKTGPLSDSEWQVIRQHPQLGHRFVAEYDYLREAADIILHHHENFDGSGYPRGLKGEAIPLGARLFRVVDAYDSMRANRVYKSFMRREHAERELRDQSGAQFDPEMVSFFLEHLEEIEKICRWQS